MRNQNYMQYLYTTAIALIVFVAGTASVYAQSGSLQNPLKFDTISAFLNAILEVIVMIGVPVVVFFIIYTGFLFVTARGNEEQLNKAKKALAWVLVGSALILGAQALSYAIQGTVDSLQAKSEGSGYTVALIQYYD